MMMMIISSCDDAMMLQVLLPPPGTPDGTAVVTDIRPSQGGDYSCVARNGLGQETEEKTRVVVHRE